LSLVKFSKTAGDISPIVASRAIVLASIANTFLKGGIVLMSGSAELKKAVWPGWLLMMAAAAVAMYFV
jgi:uncharacterized membrane protein (DUF4010 family)